MLSHHLILCCPLLFLPSILPSIRVFSNESALCIRWPKFWSFSFRIDWVDHLYIGLFLGSLSQSAWVAVTAHRESGRRCTDRGWEELPHIRGQGQKMGRPHERRAMAKRSYPTSKVRGHSWEELPWVQGQGWQQRVPGCDSTGAAERSYSTSEARGRGLEEQPHIQGAVAAWAPEGLEELFHIQGWEGRQWGDTLRPR